MDITAPLPHTGLNSRTDTASTCINRSTAAGDPYARLEKEVSRAALGQFISDISRRAVVRSTLDGTMEKSPRDVVKRIAEDTVNTAHRAAGKLAGNTEEAGNRARGAAAEFIGTSDGAVVKVRDAVGQEILDKPTFSGSPLAGPRYYLRKIVGEDLDRVIHDMRRDGVDLRDAAAMDRWLAEKDSAPSPDTNTP
ncbi:hypothetical protein [Nocardia sp. NPDC003963]